MGWEEMGRVEKKEWKRTGGRKRKMGESLMAAKKKKKKEGRKRENKNEAKKGNE